MYTAIAGILFGLVLILFNVRVSVAEIWVCTQPNGSTLYTDEPQGENSCEKFEPGSQLIYLPPRIWTTVPSPDATYKEQETYATEAQTESRVEEQATAPSDAAESYNAQQSSFWGLDENPISSIPTSPVSTAFPSCGIGTPGIFRVNRGPSTGFNITSLYSVNQVR